MPTRSFKMFTPLELEDGHLRAPRQQTLLDFKTWLFIIIISLEILCALILFFLARKIVWAKSTLLKISTLTIDQCSYASKVQLIMEEGGAYTHWYRKRYVVTNMHWHTPSEHTLDGER